MRSCRTRAPSSTGSRPLVRAPSVAHFLLEQLKQEDSLDGVGYSERHRKSKGALGPSESRAGWWSWLSGRRSGLPRSPRPARVEVRFRGWLRCERSAAGRAAAGGVRSCWGSA